MAQQGLDIPVVVVANAELLSQRAAQLGLPLTLKRWQGEVFDASAASELWFLDVALPESVIAGQLNQGNAQYVLDCLDVAIEGASAGRFSGLVTGPVHKGVVNEAGITFSGHTEYLQEKCGVERVVMMLASPAMRVALVTTHLPLKDVSAAISKDRLKQVLDILIKDLKQRGMFDDSLIIWGGEFGRTIYSQGALRPENYGRDHHPSCFSMWLAGGGIKGGTTYGTTDDYSVNVATDGVHVHDLHATVLHLLGIDHEQLTYKFQGRDYRLTDVHGNVVNDILS